MARQAGFRRISRRTMLGGVVCSLLALIAIAPTGAAQAASAAADPDGVINMGSQFLPGVQQYTGDPTANTQAFGGPLQALIYGTLLRQDGQGRMTP